MFRTVVVSAAALLLGVGLSSAFAQTPKPSDTKMTEAQCETLRTEALAGSSGDLAMAKAKSYVTDFKKADL